MIVAVISIMFGLLPNLGYSLWFFKILFSFIWEYKLQLHALMKHAVTRESWYRFDLQTTKEHISSVSSLFSFVMSLFLSSFLFGPFWVLALIQELETRFSSGCTVVSICSPSLMRIVYFTSAMTTGTQNQ